MKKQLTILLVIFLLSSLLCAQSDIEERISQLPGILSVEGIEPDSGYTEAYKILIEQPVDHFNPDGEKFEQKFYLSHRNKALPVVIVLDGYNMDYNRPNELAEILQSNKINVEHRYFGESYPENPEWKYLTIEQSANDHHQIIETLKNIYTGKWITTGISKGGQTTMYHKYFFPDDADASVCYVAPLNLAEEDPRIYHFLDNVGTKECREKMVEFQREVLIRKDELLPMFIDDTKESGYTYSLGSYEYIFEYVVLEYGFAFWQWQNAGCDVIPNSNATNEELFNHLKAGSLFSYFSDNDVERYNSFFYQAYSEIGYYGYDISELKDYLTEVKEPTSKIFIPKGSTPTFNCGLMQKVNTWLQKNGNNMLFIYGEYDTWSASAIELTGETNAVKMVKDKGSHRTRINSFEGEKLENIYTTLENWIGVEIERK
ncbi:MAG: peptidase [Ignavibacteria bacterium]|nr:peptidase [Ignavibacteria bacterium]MBT8383139.1 peptidase [Ignavibacteria bacterium]MBT8391309.1 peptidase [Ignavibacteria bacterium]NNJ53011.1 peptidase [Ignavibacteriaceae bacterium]NNL22627.1 peptidase [Ignavibacteriaceae bacterium]